jgi:coatomer protein complex subunit alpha (xenin)
MRKDTDRFWILAAHPSLNYFASGYDNGLTVFKLERENYASARAGSHIFFVKNKNLYYHDLSSKEKAIMTQVNTNGKQVMLNQPKSVYYNHFNQSSHDVILNFDTEGGCFLIYEFGRELKAGGGPKLVSEKRGDFTLAAVFLSKDKICVLDQNKDLAVCNFDGSNLKKFTIANAPAQSTTGKKSATATYAKVDMIFPAPLGKILVYSAEEGGQIALYDIAARKVLHEVSIGGSEVKAVHWNNNFTYAAIVTKTRKYN